MPVPRAARKAFVRSHGPFELGDGHIQGYRCLGGDYSGICFFCRSHEVYHGILNDGKRDIGHRFFGFRRRNGLGRVECEGIRAGRNKLVVLLGARASGLDQLLDVFDLVFHVPYERFEAKG